MKPLNLDNKPCSPISSNCVVWQGPDIPCINLCTGDTVSDVVSAMATELCTILDTLKVSNYDLTCFNLQACGPEDFQALIQFLITRICELEGVTPETKDEPGCPDCVVSVAECFVTGTQTTMQLVDYVQLIGEKVCSLITEISLINTQITDILIRLTDLENAPAPTFTLPTFTLGCTIGSLTGDQAIDTVLIEFINNVWCPFYAETGTTAELDAAGKQKCIDDADIQLNTGTAFSTNPNWILDANYDTVADAINNIWVVLCDVWNYTNTFGIEILDEGVSLTTEVSSIDFTGDGVTATAVGNAVTVNVPGTAITDTGWVDLEGFAWYGTNNINAKRVPQCRRIGNVVHFRGVAMVPLQDTLNGNIPLEWDYDSGTIDTYFNNTTVTPSQTGAGSVILSVGGVVRFNQGQSVVPNSVVDSLINFDNEYTGSFVIANRFINIGQFNEDAVDRDMSGMLNTLFQPIITTNKELRLRLIKDFEESAGSQIQSNSNIPFSTSIPNNIISHVRAGEYLPRYDNAASKIATNNLGGAQSLDLFYDNVYGTAGLTYPFNCNANDQNQVGGFGWVYLDGMTAYLEP